MIRNTPWYIQQPTGKIPLARQVFIQKILEFNLFQKSILGSSDDFWPFQTVRHISNLRYMTEERGSHALVYPPIWMGTSKWTTSESETFPGLTSFRVPEISLMVKGRGSLLLITLHFRFLYLYVMSFVLRSFGFRSYVWSNTVLIQRRCWSILFLLVCL